MPELTVADLANTCLNLLLKGATGQQVHDQQILAGRVATAIPLVAEQVLAERRAAQITEVDTTVEVTRTDRQQVTEVQKEVIETIDTFREELANRAVELNKLSQEELNKLVGSVVGLQQREEQAQPGDALIRSQFVEEQWQSVQHRLEADVARQRDALSLVALDPARPGTIDLAQTEQMATCALDATYPSTVSELRAELREVDSQIEGLRAEQRNAWSWDRHESIAQLDHKSDQMTLDAQLAMSLLAQDVARQIEECRAALQAARQLAPDGTTTALRYEAALERLAPDFELPPPAEPAGRVSPWGRDLQRSVCTDEYLKSVNFHAQLRQENIWKVFELVADLKHDGVIGPDDPVGIGRAAFHLGTGSLSERTDAAHKLPSQLTIGLDHTKLADTQLAERFRLDNLVPAAEDLLRQSVRGWFGTTTVTDLYVNAVDALWETKGLGEAFRSAVEHIVRQPLDADRQVVLDQAYARFRDDALAALDRARAHNEDKLRDLRRHPPSGEQHARTLTCEDRENMRRVLEEYERCLLEEKKQEELRQAVAWRRG